MFLLIQNDLTEEEKTAKIKQLEDQLQKLKGEKNKSYRSYRSYRGRGRGRGGRGNRYVIYQRNCSIHFN